MHQEAALEISSDPADETSATQADAPAAPGAEYRTLQAWRGLASLWVVMLHVSPPSLPPGFLDPVTGAVVYVGLLGYLGVQLFFVISGYCIANAAVVSLNRASGWRSYARARIRRIYPPYLFAVAIAVMLSLAMQPLVHAGVIRPNFISELHFFERDFPFYIAQLTLTQVPLQQQPILLVFWSLCYEIAFYAIVGLLCFPFVRFGGTRGLLNRLHLLTLGVLALLIARPSFRVFPLDLWPQFGLGVAVYDVVTHRARRLPKVAFGLFGILILILAMLRRSPELLSAAHGGDSIVAQLDYGPASLLTGLVFAVILIALYGSDARIGSWKVVRGLSTVGLFSYSLYLIHLLPVGIMYLIARKLAVPPGLYAPLMVAKLLVATLCGYVYYLCFERPFHRPAKKREAVALSDRSTA